MSQRQVYLILAAFSALVAVLVIILYQSHDEKQTALKQVMALKQQAEEKRKAEQEKVKVEQEKQKSASIKIEAETAEQKKLEEKRKFEEEELKRFQEGKDKEAREAQRKKEIEQAKVQEIEDKRREEDNRQRNEQRHLRRKTLEYEIGRLEKDINIQTDNANEWYNRVLRNSEITPERNRNAYYYESIESAKRITTARFKEIEEMKEKLKRLREEYNSLK